MKNEITVNYQNKNYAVKLNEWQKGDHHRVYVDEGRDKLGYVDLKTQKFVTTKKRISNPEFHNLVVQEAKREALK